MWLPAEGISYQAVWLWSVGWSQKFFCQASWCYVLLWGTLAFTLFSFNFCIPYSNRVHTSRVAWFVKPKRRIKRSQQSKCKPLIGFQWAPSCQSWFLNSNSILLFHIYWARGKRKWKSLQKLITPLHFFPISSRVCFTSGRSSNQERFGETDDRLQYVPYRTTTTRGRRGWRRTKQWVWGINTNVEKSCSTRWWPLSCL